MEYLCNYQKGCLLHGGTKPAIGEKEINETKYPQQIGIQMFSYLGPRNAAISWTGS